MNILNISNNNINKLVIIISQDKGYINNCKPEKVDNGEINKTFYFNYTFRGGTSKKRKKYNEILIFAFEKKIPIELYFRKSQGSCYNYYGTGIIF